MKNNNFRKVLFFIITGLITVVLSIGYLTVEHNLPTKVLLITLFVIISIQIVVLQYFYKKQLKYDMLISKMKDKVTKLQGEQDATAKEVDLNNLYLNNLSYEIRTPLSTVMGMLNMLKETNLDADQKAQVEIAAYSSKNMMQLVEMISNNAEVDEGEISLNLKAVDLKANLIHLFKMFEYQAWEKDLHFKVEFLTGTESKHLLIADAFRIQQVLVNLISNAIKFTDSGQVTVIVDQTVSIENDQIVSFYIKDTGMGIPQEELHPIINTPSNDKLEKQKVTSSQVKRMGLNIAKQLVELMGGELNVETRKEQGSTVYFSLQLKKTLNIKSDKEAFNPTLVSNFNVLVAEDNRMNQKSIKFLLEQQGADCTFVKNGVEALDLYEVLDFDMVFMDIFMPDMDGYESTKAIRNTNKFKVNKTPIIGISASAFEDDIEKAKTAGMVGFLSKPIDVAKLKSILLKYSEKDQPA
ncbi:response regulator [Gaetbulibacter saemankumensis]|uniref:response regulator n=1 Tax=Gaetbulibacter saemankumensis TaxID=311208 RepID=UPI0009FD6BD7|nr:response regulator [Gaetbulibacter saemankumensis]